MDKFVKQAFADAERAQSDREFEAWERFVDKTADLFQLAVMARVGIEKMNELARAAVKAGLAETLAEYAHELMIGTFHMGYHARMEEECQDH